MFGFDDSGLNNILMQKALDPSVTMLITLDLSQSKGVPEKALIAANCGGGLRHLFHCLEAADSV
jgi:hypothetical protein